MRNDTALVLAHVPSQAQAVAQRRLDLVLVIKLIINIAFIYIKPIDTAFTTFERDLERSDRKRDGMKQEWKIMSSFGVHSSPFLET